jgi:hypothetical protein
MTRARDTKYWKIVELYWHIKNLLGQMLQKREEAQNTMQLQLDGLHLMMCEVLAFLPQSSMVVTASAPRSTTNSAPEQTQDRSVMSRSLKPYFFLMFVMNYQRRSGPRASSKFYIGFFFYFLDLKTLFKNIGHIVWTEKLYLFYWFGFPKILTFFFIFVLLNMHRYFTLRFQLKHS